MESFDEKMNGDNCSLIGKQVEKMIGGGQGGFYLQDNLYLATLKGKWHRRQQSKNKPKP
jgi:hypothetical protein